jgi:flavorubredoxin
VQTDEGAPVQTNIDEIAPDIFRLSTFIEEVGPQGFTFNQFLIRDEQPFMFHTGMRQLYPLVSEAIGTLLPLDSLRWIAFGHVEADECGAMNLLLRDAPTAEVVHGPMACMVSLNDLADRPPRMMGDEPLDLGQHRLRFLATPHVPHNWESGLWFDETSKTLFAGDLFTHLGDPVALTEADVVGPALTAEDVFHATSMSENLETTITELAELEPQTLALMHGSSVRGDCASQLLALAKAYGEYRSKVA